MSVGVASRHVVPAKPAEGVAYGVGDVQPRFGEVVAQRDEVMPPGAAPDAVEERLGAKLGGLLRGEAGLVVQPVASGELTVPQRAVGLGAPTHELLSIDLATHRRETVVERSAGSREK